MRFVKQLIYGIVYLSVIGAVVFGVYRLNIFAPASCFDGRLNQGEEEVDCGGPNCQPCDIARLQPIQKAVKYFPVDGNTNVVLVFSNPNLDYGAVFAYTADFYDSNRRIIFSLTREAFIYPAEAQRVIVEPNLPFNSFAVSGSPDVVVADVSWKTKEEFPMPSVQLRQVQTSVSGSQAVISGIAANRESFDLKEAVIGAVLANKGSKKEIGASKTVLQALRPFEERAFKIIVPITEALTLPQIEAQIYVSARR